MKDHGPHPLLVTSDPALVEDLCGLAAAAGADLDTAPDVPAARRAWAGAPLVLVGLDQAAALGGTPLPRRPAVVLVTGRADDATVWRSAVDIGAERVAVVPDARPWLVDRLAAAADGGPGRSRMVCVTGGRGGAGATTLAAALATTARRRGLRTMLVDADPLGGGIDMVLGGEECTGLRWPALATARGTISGSALRGVLPDVDGLTVLSWGRTDLTAVPADAMASVLAAARRAGDLVVVDLPRHVDDAGAAALAQADLTLLVVPAEVRAVAAAARLVPGLAALATDVRVVVRGPSPARLPAQLVADALGLPLAGRLRPERRLGESLELGEAPARRGSGPLATFCTRLLDDLTARERTAA